VSLVIMFEIDRRPFENDFMQRIIPGLLILNSLLLLVLPTKMSSKLLGFCSFSIVFWFLYFSYVRGTQPNLIDFATWLFLSIVALNVTVWLVTSESATKLIALSVGLTTLFIVTLGVVIVEHQIGTLGFSQGRFLLLSPLVAMAMSVGGAVYKWNNFTRVIFLCAILQIAIGAFDLGQANGIAWISISSLGLGLGVLGLVAYWAKELNNSSLFR
jgi:hypothetical protein